MGAGLFMTRFRKAIGTPPIRQVVALILAAGAVSTNTRRVSSAEIAYPDLRESDLVLQDFRLESGEVMPTVRLHYATLGTPHRDPSGEVDNAVLMLHGTTGTGKQFLSPTMGPQLFGPGAPLDAKRYFVILPDGLGRGGSSKPSDGQKARFPRYGYGDVVEGQYRVVTTGLGIKHLKLILGTSMGGMQTWLWGERHPAMMDALVPIASQPIQVSGRNALWRQMLVTAIRTDPDYDGGNYARQPSRFLGVLPIFNIMTESARELQREGPTHGDAARLYGSLVAGYGGKADANDWLYWFESSFDYDPYRDLGMIKARLMAINFADDMLNPPELGDMDGAMRRIAGARYVLVPASGETHGHQSLRYAGLWRSHLETFLASLDGRRSDAPAR